MREVIGALEGDITPVLCAQDDSRCGRSGSCPSKLFWDGLKETIDAYFDATTLGNLAAGGLGMRGK
jgi:DNA-binding IscR family transcriptional regulator